ncbi:MAG: hypothetical protein ACI9U2_005075, partial [Bradymonadia bacterium]
PLVASARDISEAIAVHYAGATRHRTDGSVQDSPVDMFDFSVTDLSSIDASDPGPALGLAPHVATRAPHLASPNAAAGRRDALASLDSLAAFAPSSAPPPSRIPSLPPGAPSQSRPPPRRSSPPLSPSSNGPRALDFGSLRPGDSVELGDDVFDLGSMVSIAALTSEPERLATLERTSAPPRAAAAIDPGAPRNLPARPIQSSQQPPRLPPTSMPPRPSEAEPTPRGGDAGFGMIRRKKRRSERALQISQAPAHAEPGVLDRIDNESLRSGDRVIARYLDRFQKAPNRPGADELLAALERALRKAGSPTAQLVLVLVRQLVQQGLIDAETLVSDLLGPDDS